MAEFTFRFYGNEKHLNTRTFHAKTIEDAYKMADNVLRQTPKYDDWECCHIKQNVMLLPKVKGEKEGKLESAS